MKGKFTTKRTQLEISNTQKTPFIIHDNTQLKENPFSTHQFLTHHNIVNLHPHILKYTSTIFITSITINITTNYPSINTT